MGKFDEYDLKKLQEARKMLTKVYEYNYGDPAMRAECNRLFTIIKKIKWLEGNACEK